MKISKKHFRLFHAQLAALKIDNTCWIWQGPKDSSGYGKVRAEGSILAAHRLSYYIFKGEIASNLHVLHSCDTPACINPAHLWLGTPRENKLDSVRKGRHFCPRGSQNGRALLKETDVLLIKQYLRERRSIKFIADLFKVSCSTITLIKNGTNWGHVNNA